MDSKMVIAMVKQEMMSLLFKEQRQKRSNMTFPDCLVTFNRHVHSPRVKIIYCRLILIDLVVNKPKLGQPEVDGCGVLGWKSRVKGKTVSLFEYLTPYFGYFILPYVG